MSPETALLVGTMGSGVLFTLLGPMVFAQVRHFRKLDRRLAFTLNRLAGSRRAEGRPSLPGFADLLLQTSFRLVVGLGPLLVPVGARERDKLALTLRNAGIDRQDALSAFLTLKLASALGFAVAGAIGAVLWGAFGEYGFLALLAPVGGLVIGSVAPEYLLRAMAGRRRRKMTAALPHAFDLLVMCFETGLTFERALSVVAEQLVPIEPNIAKEFYVLESEIRVGADRWSALQDYYRRTNLVGLKDFATAAVQSERFGTSLAQATKNIAASERIQRAAGIAQRAERLPVLMSIPMLLLVVPGTMVLVAGPSILETMRALTSLGG